MLELNWHDYLVAISCLASLAGLALLSDAKSEPKEDVALSEQMLLRMSFLYWIVYSIISLTLKLPLPEWDYLLLSLKLTAILSYLLTATCILCLPLQRLAIRQVEE